MDDPGKLVLHSAGKACQGKTLWLILPTHRLQRKRSVLNTTPDFKNGSSVNFAPILKQRERQEMKMRP